MSQFAPSPNPLVLFPDFIAQRSETIVIKGKYIGDSYDVTTIDGHPLLAVNAESMSISHRKHVLDAHGKPVFNIRKETWNLSGNSYFLESPTNETKLFQLETKFSLSGNKFTGSFRNAVTGQQEQLFFKNKPFGTHGTITNNATGSPVAEIDREMLKVRKEYHITVAPGVDMALIVGMCICLDDREKSHARAAAGGAGGSAGA